MKEQLQKLGDNMIWIEAGSRATIGVRFGTRETNSLKVEDATAIFAEVPGLKRMSPNVDGRVQVIYGTQNWNNLSRRGSGVFRHTQVGAAKRHDLHSR